MPRGRGDDGCPDHLGGLHEAGERLGAGDVQGEQCGDGNRRAEADAAEGLGRDEGAHRMALHGDDVVRALRARPTA